MVESNDNQCYTDNEKSCLQTNNAVKSPKTPSTTGRLFIYFSFHPEI